MKMNLIIVLESSRDKLQEYVILGVQISFRRLQKMAPLINYS